MHYNKKYKFKLHLSQKLSMAIICSIDCENSQGCEIFAKMETLPSISLLRDLRNQNSSYRFEKDFRQSHMSVPYLEGFDFTASKDLPHKVRTCTRYD